MYNLLRRKASVLLTSSSGTTRYLFRAAAVGGLGVGISHCTNVALSEPQSGGKFPTDALKLIGSLSSSSAPVYGVFSWIFGRSVPDDYANARTLTLDHISAWRKPDYQANPLLMRPPPLNQNFMNFDECVLLPPPLLNEHKELCERTFFYTAGPREQIAFNPKEVRAAIVTCGGLCPGLNTVIQGIVRSLRFTYGVEEIYGIPYGYGGIYTKEWLPMTLDSVRDIHDLGGTILGSSRGGWDLDKMMDTLTKKKVNQLFVIGGDGTHRGAEKLANEAKRRGLNLVVAGIPKTIDNDVPFIDQSFGYRTSVGEAVRAIRAANVEANGAPNCIGLVKVMGRHAGFIALQASISARVVNCCLIPEMNVSKGKFLEYMKQRLENRGHAVVVVAEGAGATLCSSEDALGFDKSGNPILPDVGLYLKKEIKDYMKSEGVSFNLKYIDPTYMIRSVPADPDDQLLCTFLAQHAVHGAMAGFSGFTVGQVNHKFVYIPISEVTKESRQVNVYGRMFGRMLLNTGQPNFAPDGEPIDRKK